jgi:hypothetical protein
MDIDKLKYDVAFSFLQQDEELAITISQQLNPRLTSFVYSEKQAELAGTDGEVTFNRVFTIETRLAIILYRPSWGETPWTRIEQTAIRNRGFKQGYDFSFFVVLDSSCQIPEWIPKPYLYFNFNRFGVDGICAAIESKLQTMGVDTSEPSIEQKAAILNRQLEGARDRKYFLESEKAIPIAQKEANTVYEKLIIAAEKIGKDNSELRGQINTESREVSIELWGFRLIIFWKVYYMNSLKDSSFHARLSERDRTPFRFDEKFNSLKNYEFDFSMNLSNEYGWRLRSSRDRFYLSNELAEFALNLLIDQVVAYRMKELRP